MGTSSEPVVKVGVSVVVDIGIGVFVSGTRVEVEVGARTAPGVIVGEEAAHAARSNRATN